MLSRKVFRSIGPFVLVSFLYSWPIMFCVNAWLEPMFVRQGNLAAARLTIYVGHSLAMLGPALAALLLWRFYHKELPPAWKWSRLKYYGWVVLAMLAFWTLPGLIGLVFGDIATSAIGIDKWIVIAIAVGFGWIAGMGEEVGWCAYVLPQLSPTLGKTRALIVAGVIRGLWHWPVVISPVIMQVIVGERTWLELLGASVVIALQLAISNVSFGAIWGWAWYRTESIPLVGWMHFWHNLTRDMTIMLLVGYGSSLWATSLQAFVLYPLGFLLLDLVLKGEGLEWKQLFKRGAIPQVE